MAVFTLSSRSESDDPESGPDQSLSGHTPAHQYQLMPVYKNTLTRTACNMTLGPFGGTRGIVYMYLHMYCNSGTVALK